MKESIRPLVKILSGTGAAQIIALLFLPFSSRLYSPEEFGVFGTGLAISVLATTVATLQLQNAIVLPKIQSHAAGLFFLSCGGALAGGVLVAFGLNIIQSFTPAFGAESGYIVPLLVGLLVTSSGVTQAFQSLAVRKKYFGAIGYIAVVRTLVVAALQVGLGVLSMGVEGLFLAQLSGEIISALCFFYLIRISSSSLSVPKLDRMRGLLRRYRDFLIYGIAQESMMAASQGAPIWLLGHYFGGGVSGSYAFATRVLMAPCVLIGNAIRQVFSQRFAEHARTPGRLTHEFRVITIALVVFFIPAALLISPFFPDLFFWFFGEPWKTAGEYSKWLFVWMVMGVCNAPATLIFRTVNRQKESFGYNVALLGVRLVSLVICGLFASDYLTIVIFSMLGVVMNVVFIFMAHYYSSRSDKSVVVSRLI